MIDLHTHVLPGVDDGAEDLDEAVAMCALAADDGCEALVATPHQRHPHWANQDLVRLERLHAELRRAVAGRIAVHLGAEVRVDDEALADIVPKETAPRVLALAGSHYLLLELERMRSPREPLELVHELVVAGWRPILAHPEMFPWLLQDGPLLDDLRARGAAFQITAMSLTGEFGRPPQEACFRLLEAGLVDFVASDCHSTSWRPPGRRRARRALAARWGEDVAERLTRRNPQAVLEDRPLAEVSAA